MKVAIDSGPLGSGHKLRGVGAYTREIIAALKKIQTADFRLEEVELEQKNLGKYEVLHYTYFHPFFLTLPSEHLSKSVVTIHDLIQLIYPKQYQPGIKGKFKYFIQKNRVKKIGSVIAPSETSKKDILRLLNIPPDKVHVIYEAPKEIYKIIDNFKKLSSIRKKYSLPEKFILYVGDVNYNKNISTLVNASKLTKIPLVVCGKQAKDIEEQKESLENLRGPRDWFRFLFNIPHPELAHYELLSRDFVRNQKVMRLGFVPDEDLAAIYNLASVYVQPSLYEGFGLPVLEAMSCCCPVVISKTNTLVEIASGAALRADANSPEDFSAKITEILKNPSVRSKLINSGIKRAKQFSWDKAAKETLKVYKEVAGKS